MIYDDMSMQNGGSTDGICGLSRDSARPMYFPSTLGVSRRPIPSTMYPVLARRPNRVGMAPDLRPVQMQTWPSSGQEASQV